MKKKILIIGYGSIGERHAKIFKKFKKKFDILIFTKRTNLKFKSTDQKKEVINFDPDYIFVCSETIKHYEHLSFIDKNFKNKIVLIEKPLFHKAIRNNFKKNKYFLGYNLRFHPVLKLIKIFIKKEKIFSIQINCSSHLPNWRPKRNYKNVYSSNKKKGGGVLLDLSHELDYLQWLTKKITKIELSKLSKISKLKIDVEDQAIVIGKINKINFNINLNFFSRVNQRFIIVDAKNVSIKGDLVKNTIEIIRDKRKSFFKFSNKSCLTYFLQDKSLIKKNFKNHCSLKEGFEILKLIDKIKNAI